MQNRLNHKSLFFRLNEPMCGHEQVPEGNGSGFIWDEEGHIVTNYHGKLVSHIPVVKLINAYASPCRLSEF